MNAYGAITMLQRPKKHTICNYFLICVISGKRSFEIKQNVRLHRGYLQFQEWGYIYI